MVHSTLPRRRAWSEAELQAEADRRTASLAGVAVTLLLLTIGLFLVHTLHHAAAMQDCILSGRHDCAAAIAIP